MGSERGQYSFTVGARISPYRGSMGWPHRTADRNQATVRPLKRKGEPLDILEIRSPMTMPVKSWPMYSLFVTPKAAERNEGTFNLDIGRFLEYTEDAMSNQLRSLSNEAQECIRSWPCILMQEGRGQEQAYLVQVNRLETTKGEIKATISLLPETKPLSNDDLWRVRDDLDIGEWEFNRNHWAFKDRDLFEVLTSAGHRVPPAVSDRFKQLALPAPERQQLLKTRDVVSNWGHTQINDFLLEVGINDLDAVARSGSRRDRAIAIVKFILDNPSVATAENSLLSAFLVRRTLGEVAVPEEDRELEPPLPVKVSTSRSPNRVFVVHGQNEKTRDSVVAFLESVGLRAIVLHDQPNMGRHLLTKFIDEAELVTFAVVLMTDDDEGGAKGQELRPRARQNVILELGYFLAHLGQPKVCALITPGLETPSDFDGIVYIKMDDTGTWQKDLKRELVAAKMPLSEVMP